MVAGKPAGEAVFDQPRAAIGALVAKAAIAAQRQRGIAAPVEEQQRLFAAFEPRLDPVDQPLCQPHPLRRLFLGQVDRLDRGHLRPAVAARQVDLRIDPAFGHLQALERGGGAGEHHGHLLEMPAHHRDVARIVAHALFLLEAGLVRFVDHDQAEPCEGQEQRRARADHHLRAAFGYGAVGAPAFGRFERRVPQHRRRAEPLLEAVEEVFGQRDFGQQDQHLPLHPQRLRNGFEIGLGLARSGHPVEQEGGKLRLAHRVGKDVRRLALLRAQRDLDEIGPRGRIGAVAIDLYRLECAVVDKPAQHAFGNPGDPRQFVDRRLLAFQRAQCRLALRRHAFGQAAGQAVFGHCRGTLERAAR